MSGRHRRGLHSSRFERISENELDQALEAIKEESREGSVSPTHRDRDHHIEFSWEAMSSAARYDSEMLMGQLESLSIQHMKQMETNSALLRSGGGGTTVASGVPTSGDVSGTADDRHKPVYIDLRHNEQVTICIHVHVYIIHAHDVQCTYVHVYNMVMYMYTYIHVHVCTCTCIYGDVLCVHVYLC